MGELDGYLAKGEQVVYRALGDRIMLVCTDRRLIMRDDAEKMFKDPDYSHIVSIGWKNQAGGVNGIIGLILVLLGLLSLMRSGEISPILGTIFLIVGVVLLYCFSSTKSSLVVY